jgi:hypothetical protein
MEVTFIAGKEYNQPTTDFSQGGNQRIRPFIQSIVLII